MPRLTSRPASAANSLAGADADGHDDQVGLNHAAVGEFDAVGEIAADDAEAAGG